MKEKCVSSVAAAGSLHVLRCSQFSANGKLLSRLLPHRVPTSGSQHHRTRHLACGNLFCNRSSSSSSMHRVCRASLIRRQWRRSFAVNDKWKCTTVGMCICVCGGRECHHLRWGWVAVLAMPMPHIHKANSDKTMKRENTLKRMKSNKERERKKNANK